MGKCLVTKLTGVVNNDSLLKLGELRLAVKATEDLQQVFQFNNLTYSCNVDTLAGDTEVPANTIYEVHGWKNIKCKKNGEAVFSLKDKYNMISVHTDRAVNNVEGLSYLLNCAQFTIASYSGDLISLSDFSNSPKIESLRLEGNITGDLADLSKCTAISSLRLGGNITGDLATVSPKAYLVSVATSNTLTWSYRENSKTLFSLQGNPKVSNIDKMLQDLSNCTVVSTDSIKQIVATGNRTSASDAAVQTLQSKGYTVSITPA